MPKPWLSVVIPTYNGELFLKKALQSVVEQAEDDLECIIIDDGSTDATVQIIDSYADKIPINLQRIQRTGNWVANSNLALTHATGDYACFLHQDDFWLANRLQTMKELSKQYPDAELFLSPALFVNRQGDPVGPWRCPLPKPPGPISSELLRRRLLIQNFIAIPSPMFKRKTALDLGGLDESLWYTADWDFWLKLGEKKTVYHPRPLAAFRIHSHSQTVRRSFDINGFQRQMEIVLDRYAEGLAGRDFNKKGIKRAALFSIQVNAALATKIHGGEIRPGPLLASFLRLGPMGWWRYLRDSRITDRILARLRAAVTAQ